MHGPDADPPCGVPDADKRLLPWRAVDDCVQEIAKGSTTEPARTEVELFLAMHWVGDDLNHFARCRREDPQVLLRDGGHLIEKEHARNGSRMMEDE